MGAGCRARSACGVFLRRYDDRRILPARLRQQAARLSAEATGLSFSGQLGFTDTEMAWPLSHMVAPADKALRCIDCHGPQGRMDFQALGYSVVPMQGGGRRP